MLDLERTKPGGAFDLGKENFAAIKSAPDENGIKSFRENGKKAKEFEEIADQLEEAYLKKIAESNDTDCLFQLAQLYFDQNRYEEANNYYLKCGDLRSFYQLGVLHFDKLIQNANTKTGVDLMMAVSENYHVSDTAATAATDKKENDLPRLASFAEYNVGLAYYQGYGVSVRSDDEAERWWLMAADDGNPKASVRAQSVLGLFYSRKDSLNLKKAFFWHNEACGNGSLESQACLGVMYELGLGTKKNASAAFECYRCSAERGSIYGMGCLVSSYYNRKMFTKCVELGSKVSEIAYEDADKLSKDTDCLKTYIYKGISLASFYYARCLDQGFGVATDLTEAKKYYSRSFQFDPDTCTSLMNKTQHGAI